MSCYRPGYHLGVQADELAGKEPDVIADMSYYAFCVGTIALILAFGVIVAGLLAMVAFRLLGIETASWARTAVSDGAWFGVAACWALFLSMLLALLGWVL